MANVDDLFSRVITVLNDASMTRWTEPELLRWFNDGLRDLVVLDPTAYQLTATATLVAGARQAIPSDAVMLIDVVGNINVDNTVGAQIRMCDRASLDALFPNWQAENPRSAIKNAMYEPTRNRRVYWVYPPVTAGTKVQLVYSMVPSVAAKTNIVPVDPMYYTPLTDYVLSRAFSKDDEVGNQARASAYMKAFVDAVAAIAAVRGNTQPKE